MNLFQDTFRELTQAKPSQTQIARNESTSHVKQQKIRAERTKPKLYSGDLSQKDSTILGFNIQNHTLGCTLVTADL